MFGSISRRHFLKTTSSAAALGGLAATMPLRPRLAHAAAVRRLAIETRTLEVLGKPATVFGIRQADGRHGLILDPGERFRVDLSNRLDEATIVHWHGMTPPWEQDGVADARRPPIPAGGLEEYDFEPRPGTHWMHSHFGLQEQRLLAAPLIVRTAEDARADVQEVVVMLHDFSFRDPEEIFAELTGTSADHGGHGGHGGHGAPAPQGGGQHGHAQHGAGMGHDMGHGMGHDMGHAGAGIPMPAHLNDVIYDAFFANDRTLDDPEVVPVERGGTVRLRLINGASSSAFWIDLGALAGEVVAVDGNAVAPVPGNRFPIAMGQRLDILLRLPREGGAFPVFAQLEGERSRTGLVLATPGAKVARIADLADAPASPVDLSLEAKLRPLAAPPARPADARFALDLTGAMQPYAWSMDDPRTGQKRPIPIQAGQRVEIEMRNPSDMMHPMHLHGHHFQVVALNGRPLAGAVRDTVVVPVKGSVTVAFDADNPGPWLLHCHNLYHMRAGMMVEVIYEGAA